MVQRSSGRARERRDDDFTYDIVKHYGVISQSGRGWTRELNFVRWNERDPKYDLRDWSPDHDKMSKGITLNAEEVLGFISLVEENIADFTGEVIDEPEDTAQAQETSALAQNTVQIPAAEAAAAAQETASPVMPEAVPMQEHTAVWAG